MTDDVHFDSVRLRLKLALFIHFLNVILDLTNDGIKWPPTGLLSFRLG